MYMESGCIKSSGARVYARVYGTIRYRFSVSLLITAQARTRKTKTPVDQYSVLTASYQVEQN